MKRWQKWLLVLLVIADTGCGSQAPPPPPAAPPPPPPTSILASIEAAVDINPDPDGRPSPLRLRLYELKTPDKFNNSDFFSLYEQANAVLGADLLGHDELLIKPGEKRLLERVLTKDTLYLGILAAYRDLDRAVWRAILLIPPNQLTPVKIELKSTAVTAEVTD